MKLVVACAECPDVSLEQNPSFAGLRFYLSGSSAKISVIIR